MSILEAAATEIKGLLNQELDARVFARVLFIARRAEEIACSEGRADEIAVKTKALETLEGKAPLTHAAVREDLLGGAPVLRAKQIQLEKDHAKVRDAAAHLQAQRENFQEEVRALTSGEAPIRQLSSGSLETEDETDEEPEYTPPALPEAPVESLKMRQAFERLPKAYEAELEDENSAHKKDADRF